MEASEVAAECLCCANDECHAAATAVIERAKAEWMAERDARIEALEAEVNRLSLDSIHTCHDQCQRTACVLRRERDALEAEVARLREQNAAAGRNVYLLQRGGERLCEALRRIQDEGCARSNAIATVALKDTPHD